ncbi:MAG: InlB B-repeat-containing protein [Alphaproteobacteria bacterium]|nr:InlB B-repeat-containing protein [Alphaproteobacteria bacterium]
MGKIRCFLRFFVLFAGVVFTTNSFAAGYICDDIKMYTSCNAGYYLNGTEVGNSCVACPENSSTTDENSASACTCSTGYSVGGTTTGATTTTTTACSLIETTITLNNTSATTAGTTKIYGKYGTNVYLDAARTKVMTTSANPITVPKRSYTITYDANGGTVATTSQTATYTFNGYFTAATGGTQLVGATGYITDAGTTQIKATSKNLTLYAQWTGVPVTMPTPERAGYIFNGWATSSTATSGSTGEYTPADNVKLYAIWGGSTYDCEAGTYWDADTAKCAQCTAGNYCKGVAGSNSGVDAGLTICPAGTSATSAKTENDCYFTITLNKNGGSGTCGGTSSTSDGSATCYYNKACTLPSWNASSCGLSNGAKIFKGWATSNDATSGSTALTFKATTTVYAVWETPTCSADNGTAKPANTTTNAPKCTVTCNNGYGTSGTYTGTVGSTSYNYACSANSITIKYDTNGATSGVPAVSSQNCSYNGTCLATSQGTMLKTNSTFQGWASTNNATVAEYAPGASIKNIITSGEKTLYAVWSACTACAEGTGATCVLSVVNNQCSYATNCATGYKDISNSGAYNPSCDPITYTIVYNANGGSGTTATSTHTYNKSDTLSTNGFTNGAKQFLGWAETSGASSAKYANKQSVSNLSSVDGAKVNLYAVWGAECTCDRGTGVASCTPSAPLGICGTATATASAGYNTATCGTSSNNVSKCSATPNKYTVTFNANTGSGTMSSQSFTYGVAQNLSENKFTKDGLKFQGWARSSDGNVEYSDKESVSNLTTNNNGSVSLYAIWGDAVSYTITYKIADGATHSNATTYTVESPVTFTDASKAGYTFGGWFNDAAYNNRITKTSGTGNITVYGKLTPNEYTVTYNCNGGNTQTPYSNTQTVTFDDKFTTQPGAMCARTGYTFTGWNGKYPKANTEYTYTTVGNTTLAAQWTANKYTCDKGEYLPMLKTQCESCPEDSYCGGGEYTYSTSVNQGITGTCPTEYPDSELGADAKEDCYNLVTVTKGNIPTNCHSATWASCNYKDFYGITTETACVPTVTSVTAKAGAYVNGATLSCVVCGTGKYQITNGSSATSCANSCTTGYTITGTTAADHDSSSDCYRVITLDKNGGAGSLGASVTCYQGADCNFGDASVLTQTGYTFTGGWGTSQSCTAKVSTFTTPSNSTYYACKTANQYTISFDANGGTGGQSADVLATYDSTMPAISATAPTKAGYVFTGWFDAKTGGTQYYTAVGQSARTWDIAKATTLYAQWAVGGMNNVTFNENGGTTVSDTECNVMSGDITLPTITRAGHTFDGWYNDATGEKATSVAAGTCVSEMSFTAKWTKCADCTKGTGVSTCSVSVSNNTCVASAECATGYETPKCTGLSCVCTPKSYTVTYNCGDGTGTAPANATAIYNTGFAPATNTCTEPVGYDFSHWNDGTTIHTAGTDFLWTYTSGKTFTAEYVAEGAKTITYVTPDDTKWSGDYMLSCNADTDTFALPTADNIARAGYTFAGWKDDTGATVTSVTKGTCTASLTFTAQWNACNSTEDGACGCASGTYPSNGVCSSCTTSCSALGAEYQGTYNICVAGDAEQQCYKTCEISCVVPSSCPGNFLKCEFLSDTKLSGVQYYDSEECVVSSTACPVDLYSSQTVCKSGYYMSEEYPTCSATCESLEPVDFYNYSSMASIQNGPNACYDACAPTCDYANDYVINEQGEVSGNINHCPEHATCTEGTLPNKGYRWYPQTVCTPTSFCSFTFVCDAGYVANTTSAVQYGYRKTLYGSPMTASDVASCTPGTYAVTLNDNNGVGGQGTVYQTYTVGWYDNAAGGASLESIVLPTRNGYTFMGYYDSKGTLVIGTDGLLPANNTYTADITLVAQWTPNSYTIKYNLNGGYYAGNSNPETYTIEDAFVLSNPTKRGYDFGGWFSDSGFNTSVTEISAGTIGNKEFWAKWTPVTYKITYNLNGGTYKTGESNPDEYTVETNTIVLKKPEKTGFTFSKWTDANGNTVTQIINGSIGDMVLTANWTSDSYVITYDLDGGTNNAENPDAYTISDTPIALKDPVKTGYIFDGWTGDKVENNEIVAGTTGHITVVANWTPTTFTVHFDPTDAGSLNVADVTCVYDMECAAADTIEMPNKTFSVWNTQKDGKGKTIVANGSIKNLLSDGGEITLYAIWDQNMVACEAGYYYNNGVRTRCELGKYCPGSGEINEGSTGCMETCPANGATTTAGADSISDCRKVTTDGGDMTFNFGTAKWDCWYTSGSGNSAIYTTNCDSIALTCDAGYYYSGVGNACTPVTDGYYSPAPVVENGTEDTESMAAHACPGETGAANDGIGSNAPRATEADCYSACSLTTSDITNSKTVTPDEANAPYNTASAEYAACSYTITCNAGYTAKNGTNPQCVANKYTVTLDKNQGTGDVTAYVECTFDSGACKLPATDGLARAGYVSANKWCTNANGSGACYAANVATSENISANGSDTKLYAIWEPDVFKIELVASDATENATQKPVYLKYTVGWFEDVAANKALTTIDTSALPGKSGYNFAGYSVGDVMIIDAAGTLQNTNAALRVTTNDTTANVVWSEGDTVCEAGYYYPGRGGDCVVCAADHWCPGGTYPTDTGVVGGHEICPDGGISAGGASATNSGVCYKQGLAYTSTTGKASGTQTCNYDEDTKAYDASCRDHSVKKCVAGYYYVSGIDCVEVGINHYSGTDDLKRYECPENGLTGTLTTADDAGECYKTVEYNATYGAGTQVCNYTSDNADGSAKYATNCRDKYITTCQGGYYRENAAAIDCTAVGYDAYSEPGSLNRTPCPDGGDTNVDNAAESTSCFKAENPFTSDHGSGFQYCIYSPENKGYTECRARMFQKCDPGYYWNAIGDTDCTKVGYGFFGPVADAGNEGRPTARQGCATFDGRAGQTESDTSSDASACFMTEMPCSVAHGGGIKTCGYNTNAEDYSSDCTACMLDTCDEKYYINNNQCDICPAGSICDESTRTGFDGVANAEPQVCSALFDGRYPESDAGSTNVGQCFGDCDAPINVTTMVGRDYQGADMTDTCEIQVCDTRYYLAGDKSQCELCPENSVCDAMSGSDIDLDGTPDGVPMTCDELTGGTHKLSGAGSTKIEQCYTTCEDYEILGGMAIRDSDTVQYDNVCTFKGMSETGNPCEIQTIKGYETCVETSCNPDYELIDGRCQRCERANATAYKPNGNCLVAKCHTGFHPEGDQCADDVKTCTAPNAYAASQTWDNKLGAFGICKITECVDGYHVSSNACVPDVEVCSVEHGTGTREWDENRGTWGECIATSCEPGYTNDSYESDEPNKQCGRCRNAKSVLGQDAASSYIEGCTIAACMYQGELYNLENNECVPICPVGEEYEDETGTMIWNPDTKKCERKCNPGYMSW